MRYFLLAIGIICFVSCNNNNKTDTSNEAKKLIFDIENAFAKAVAEKGEKQAFLEFADDSVALNRGEKIYSGKAGIIEYYSANSFKNSKLNWKADFADASSSGDFGYTFGKYQFSFEDSLGKRMEYEGIFHTVWKKQKDGSWKFVYD